LGLASLPLTLACGGDIPMERCHDGAGAGSAAWNIVGVRSRARVRAS
jgi:hypothetical protein